MRRELTLLSNLLGYQIKDINRIDLGVAADYVVNTCETYILYLSMAPAADVNNQADIQMLLPFEMVTINSGVLNATDQVVEMQLPVEPFQFAPIAPNAMKLTPTDWEPGVRDYWNPFVRLSGLTTECMVTDPSTGKLVPVYKTAYASELLGVKLYDALDNELGTVLEAIMEPETGKLRYYVVQLIDEQGLTLVPLGKTNIPKEVLDSGAQLRLVLISEKEKLFNAPRYDGLEDATSDSAIEAAFQYW
jgi:sporulation protein YlmC with PRC-barrel domain